MADGAKIIVSAGGSMEPTLNAVAAAFKAATGTVVEVTYHHDIDEPDVLVLPMNALERRSGFVGDYEDGAISVGRSTAGLGVAVRRGAVVPDISNVDAFKQSLLAADRILLTDGRTSSIYMAGVLKDLGVDGLVNGKIRRESIAQQLVQRLNRGAGNEVMVLSIREIIASATEQTVLVGPLPELIQLRVEFFVVPHSASTKKELAWAFAHFCAGPGRHLFVEGGFE